MSAALLHVQSAEFHEPGRGAVKNIDLVVDPGELVLVMGGEGSGKTVLLRGCLGLVEPDVGSVSLFGCPLRGLAHDDHLELLERCALASSSAPLLSNQSLRDNVAVPLWMRGVDPDDALAQVDALFEKLGITDVAVRRPDDVLPRARDLALLARALAQPTDLVVLDEPPNTAAARALIREKTAAGTGVLIAARRDDMFPDAHKKIALA